MAEDKKDKKEKKDKKDKKDKKKDKKKEKKKEDKNEIKEIPFIDENDKRFNPVPNPAFNPDFVSPATSPNASVASLIKPVEEKWVISAKKTPDNILAAVDVSSPTITQQNNQQTSNTDSHSPPTPAELQGFTAHTYMPSPGYGHLDPTLSDNTHSAYDQLKKMVITSNSAVPQNISAQVQQPQLRQPAIEKTNSSSPRPLHQPQYRPPQTAQPSQSRSPPPQLIHQQYLSQIHPPQQQNYFPPPVRPVRPPTNISPTVEKVRVRALWSYTAKIDSELSFNAGDTFSVINKQPDEWWFVEPLKLAQPGQKTRGLVPGNYMAPVNAP